LLLHFFKWALKRAFFIVIPCSHCSCFRSQSSVLFLHGSDWPVSDHVTYSALHSLTPATSLQKMEAFFPVKSWQCNLPYILCITKQDDSGLHMYHKTI
jgi:hypothetical protein